MQHSDGLGPEGDTTFVRVPIIGVIEPGARAAVEETRNRRIGVLATPLTAASGAYRRAVHSLDAGVEVHEQSCPEFVPMIERGVVDGPELERVARGYLQPIMERRVDAVVLGCTHYPLISAPINRILGPEVRLISSQARQPWRLAAYSPAATAYAVRAT